VSADRLHELLERLGNLLRAEARGTGGDPGLQPVQAQALAYLARCNRYSDSPAAVAEFLGLTKGTVSQTLAVLQQRGLVTTTDDPDDGRRVHLRLTAKGRRAVDRLASPPFAAAVAAVPRVADLVEQLEHLLVALQRARGGRTFGVCRTCRHFRTTGEGAQCGLTGEALAAEQTTRICREHEVPSRATS
jgi:DNA-binding MarR family transcriptional regulator